jgi:phytoene synthase
MLKTSYRACENIARERARNFYYAFTVFPKAKRQAICAMYAFMRYCDDISDSDNPSGTKLGALDAWRSALDNAVAGNYGQDAILPAFHHTVSTFNIPSKYFHELIDGAQMDLSINRYQTFDELYQYCYRVASVVGLVCLHIFGFNDDRAMKHAEHCGIAFQLTNILRDIKEDAERDRIYLPQEDLERFDVSEENLLNGVMDNRFHNLMRFQVQRAKDYYAKASPLVSLIDTASRPGLTAMVGIYSSLLDRIEDRGYDVFSSRVALSTKEKLGIAARSMLLSRPNGRDSVSSDTEM